MGKDLGTYFLRIELRDERGWIQSWPTGWRYTDGTAEETLLTATPIPPTWNTEEDLLGTMRFMYLAGNYSCDCNKSLFLARAHQSDQEDLPCGDTMQLRRLTVIRPDRSETVIYPETQNLDSVVSGA